MGNLSSNLSSAPRNRAAPKPPATGARLSKPLTLAVMMAVIFAAAGLGY
jgi:hypothetical protein